MMTVSMSRLGRAGALLTLSVLAMGGCDKPRAMGDTNQILVAAPTPVWQALEQDIKAALEPRTFTVRDERVFDVAHADPTEAGWENLRVMRQVLVIGDERSPAVAQVLDKYNGEVPAPPTVIQVRNVWAQNQLVTLGLLAPQAPPQSAAPLLPTLGEMYLRQFEEYARARMFVTEANTALADSLRREAGFSLVLPRVYHYRQVEPGTFIFRNDQTQRPLASEGRDLIRNITVASRPAAESPFDATTAVAWRNELVSRHTQPPQVTEPLPEASSIDVAGRRAIQVHGVWSNPPGEWPAAGPFITRLFDCGDRVFLVDAWLYAPGVSKYEYMFQLNTVLNSFECGGARS